MQTSSPGSNQTSVSTKPWSDYSAADYTLQQWDAACLIHDYPEGTKPTSKDQCKLPVKTPDGVINKDGVFAAAAVLAGARGGVNASAQDKSSAAKSLLSIYAQMKQTPPPSLIALGHSIGVGEFLEHHGVKGQKWGFRKERVSGAHADAHSLSDDEIQKRIKRMDLEKKYNDLSKSSSKSAGTKYVHDLLQNSGKQAAGAAVGGSVAFIVGKALKAKFG